MSTDVAVVGGGPAGSTIAALLAQQGHAVMLLERETFPRYHVGESLMPATFFTFERLGVVAKLEAAGFVPKQSVQFFAGSGKAATPFYFTEVNRGPAAATWQVDRSRFDRLLLEHAAEQGVDVQQPAAVTEILMEGNRAVGVKATLPGGQSARIGARVVVDASGQNAMLSRRLGLMRFDPKLRHAAFLSYYRGAMRDAGRDAGATLILHTENRDSWFWYIPLPGDVVGVGVVGHVDHLVKGRAKDPERVFAEELARCPALVPRLRDAEKLEPVQVLRDFSYTARAIAGDGWVLVGDAFGFLDPIYSSGVFLALKGAELAADSVHAGLVAGDLSAAALGRHGQAFLAGMEALRRLVYAYYDRSFSFAGFLAEHPDCREDLVNLLVGNVYRKCCTGILAKLDAGGRPDDYEPLSLAVEKV